MDDFFFHLIFLIPSALILFTLLLISLIVVIIRSRIPIKIVPILAMFNVMSSGLFFSPFSAFIILDLQIPTPFYSDYHSCACGCCGPELALLIFTSIISLGVTAVGGICAYILSKRYHRSMAIYRLGVSFLAGSMLGIVVGLVFHFLPI